jgi:parallel beta-helix repeat protein
MVLFEGCDDCDGESTYIAATRVPGGGATNLEDDQSAGLQSLSETATPPASIVVIDDTADNDDTAGNDEVPGDSTSTVVEGEQTVDGQPAEAGDPVIDPAAPGASDQAAVTDDQAAAAATTTTVAPTTTEAPTTTAAPTTTTTQAPRSNPGAAIGSVPANGDTFYVSSRTGNDSNDGRSASSPWKSLRGAMKRLAPGQTLLVMDGEYREVIDPGTAHYSVNSGGRADAWIRIAAHPGHNPTIVANQGTGLQIISPYVEVSGLTIRGEGFNKDNAWGVGISVTETHHVRLIGNRVTSFPVSGISITKSDNFDVIGNDVSYSAFWSPLQGSGISVWHAQNKGKGAGPDGYHARIIGNRVYGNENKVNSQHKNYTVKTDGNGIIIDSNVETGYSGRTLIANNVVFDNGGRGIIVWQSNKVDIVFNTSYHNGRTRDISGGATELAAGKANDVVIANNVGWARSGWPAIIFDRVSNGSSYNNVLITDSPSGNASGRDTMHSGNPGLRNPTTDPGSADFRPNSNSILRGGVEDSPRFISVDRVGTSRTSGTPDIGAYEAEASRR